jgi:hypothetical protein
VHASTATPARDTRHPVKTPTPNTFNSRPQRPHLRPLRTNYVPSSSPEKAPCPTATATPRQGAGVCHPARHLKVACRSRSSTRCCAAQSAKYNFPQPFSLAYSPASIPGFESFSFARLQPLPPRAKLPQIHAQRNNATNQRNRNI